MHPLEDIETSPYLEEDMEDVPDIAQEMDDLPMMPTTQWAIDNNEWRKAVQAYLACVSFVDHYVGEIQDLLFYSWIIEIHEYIIYKALYFYLLPDFLTAFATTASHVGNLSK